MSGNTETSVSSSKVASTPNMKLTGPEACAYRYLAKQPGNDFKIRLHEMERTRTEKLRMEYEDDFKSLIRHALQKELIDVADRKCLYNKIKRMVECEMKANEHLFVEDCAKLEVKDEEVPEQSRVSKEDLIEKLKELNKKKEEEKRKVIEEERKIVEEKRLQLFIENSEELRFAAMAKRKKDIADLNYKMIQEKERVIKEQKLKKREQNNLKHTEIIKKQIIEKEEEKRRLMEKQQQLRKVLYEQVQEKRVLQEQEKELKEIERNEFKKLNEKLNEEEELEKLERIKKKTQRKEEIERFNEERANFFAKLNEDTKMSDKIYRILKLPNLKDETTEEIEAKIQLRRENEMFLKHHAMVKEQRRQQCKEITDMVLKQKKEIEEIKRAIERENAETRRKRLEEGNKALKEQLKLREIHLQQQKDMKRKTYEQSVKEYEAYLAEEKEIWEKKRQCEWQIRRDLNDQIKSRKDIIEKQRKIDLESHKNCMMEIAEHEKLLKKLLSEL